MTEEIKENIMGYEPIPKLIMKLSLPLMLSMLIQALYNVVDSIFVARVSEASLTAVSLAFPLQNLMIAFAVGTAVGVNSYLARKLGEQNRKEAEHTAGNGLFLSLLTWIAFALFGLFGSKPFMSMFTDDPELLRLATGYTQICLIFSFGVFVDITAERIMQATGDSIHPMMTQMAGAITNIILDPVFIFLFDMGVKGAAIATVFSQTVSCIFVILFLSGKNAVIRLRTRDMHLSPSRVWGIISLGTSGFVMGATNSVVQLVCNRCAFIWGGDLYVGVMTILNSVREVFSTFTNGISSGASPVMSFNYGARDGERVMKASNAVLSIVFVYSLVVWAFVFSFPRLMAMLFTDDEMMLSASVSALHIYFFGFFFMAFQSAGQQTFVALGKAGYAIFFSLFRKVIIVVPLTIALPYIFGVNGVMLAEPISNVIGGLAAYLTMRHIVFPELRGMDGKSPASEVKQGT